MVSFLFRRFRVHGEPHLLAVTIVDGQNPNRLLDRHLEAVAFLVPGFARLAVDARKHGATLAYLYRVWFRAARDDEDFDAVVALHGFEDRTLFVDAVAIRLVSRVCGVLRALQPIAAITLAEPRVSPFGHAVAVHHQDIIARQWRGAIFSFAHIGKNKAAQFLNRIPRMADVRRGLDGFGWTIDDIFSPVVTSTVVGGTDILFLDTFLFQINISTRYFLVQHCEST